MRTVRFVLFTFIAVLLMSSQSFAVGGGGINVHGNPYVSYDFGQFSLTIPEISISGFGEIWATWNLNPANNNFELAAFGFVSDIKGMQTATGRYVHDPQRGVLILDVQQTDYRGCGMSKGIKVMYASFTTLTTMSLIDPLESEEGEIIALKQSGGSGIVGTWIAFADSNSVTLTFNADGTFLSQFALVQCALD